MILKNDSKSAAEGSVEDAAPKLTINERGVGYLVDVIGDQTVDNRGRIIRLIGMWPLSGRLLYVHDKGLQQELKTQNNRQNNRHDGALSSRGALSYCS